MHPVCAWFIGDDGVFERFAAIIGRASLHSATDLLVPDRSLSERLTIGSILEPHPRESGSRPEVGHGNLRSMSNGRPEMW